MFPGWTVADVVKWLLILGFFGSIPISLWNIYDHYRKNSSRLVTQRPEAVASRAKRSEIVDLQLTNQIPDLHYPTIPYNTLQYLHYPTLKINIVATNNVIWLVTQRPEAVASRAKQSETAVDRQLTNQIPLPCNTLQYPTLE